MKNKLHQAFDSIRADDKLKEGTLLFIEKEREKRQKRNSFRSLLKFKAAYALMAIFCIMISLLAYNQYSIAAAYVSIDASPAVELTLNRMDRVIATHAFNADGERLLLENDLVGKQCSEALEILIAAMEQDGYFSDNPFISMTVQAEDEDKEQVLCDDLWQTAKNRASTMQTSAVVEIAPLSAEVRGNAYGWNISPAKYLAIQELLAVDETATLEQYSESSIRQIRTRTQQCREEHDSGGNSHESTSSTEQGNDNGNGQGNEHGAGQGSGNGHGNGHGYHGGR